MKFKTYTSKTPLNKGWSNDRKFILKRDGETVLLRVLEKTQFYRKIQELNYLSELDCEPNPFSRPLSVELVKDKVHFITSYIEGADLSDGIEKMSEAQQIDCGHQAGRVLKQIHHQIKIEPKTTWETFYSDKIKRKIKSYYECGLSFENDQQLIDRCLQLMPLIQDRPMAFQHGDYHIGNFVYCSNGVLGVLDFDRWDLGDPWEEFNRIVWCREKSPLFASAMIDAYFDFKIPDHFFELMFLYIGVNALGSLSWALNYGEAEVKVMLGLIEQFKVDTNQFTQVKPLWYQATSK